MQEVSRASGLSQWPAASISVIATAATADPSTVTTAASHTVIASRGAKPSAVIRRRSRGPTTRTVAT